MVTLSIVKADTRVIIGHSAVHPAMIAETTSALDRARGDLLLDGKAPTGGDDLWLIMTPAHGTDAAPIHCFASDVFTTTTRIAKDLDLYGAGQDILFDVFSGNPRGMGPGYAELDFDDRPSELVLRFLTDETEPGAWDLPPVQDVRGSHWGARR